MPTNRLSIAVLSALALCCATRVHAVPRPTPTEPPRLAYPGQPIPANGGLATIGVEGEVYVEMRLRTAPEVVVDGSVITVSPYHVWSATAPLTPGLYDATLIYNAAFASAPPIGHETVMVVDAVELGMPAVQALPELELIEEHLISACCNPVHINDPTACSPTKIGVRPHLTVELTFPAPPEVLNQYLFRIAPPAALIAVDGVRMWDPYYAELDAPRGFDFLGPADEYCYQVDAIELATGIEYLNLPVAASCLPHGDEVPWLRELPVEDSFLDHATCELPPPEHKARWCMLNEAPCSAPSPPESCLGYGYACRGEPFPDTTPPVEIAGSGGSGGAGAGGAGGAAGGPPAGGSDGAEGLAGASGQSGASGQGGAAGMNAVSSEQPSPKRTASSCAITAARAGAHGSMLAYALGAAALLVAARRRK